MISKILEKFHLSLLRGKVTFLLILFSATSHAKVLIFTYAYNRPDFIALQHTTFNCFMKDDFELIVFNDAINTYNSKSIKKVCKACNLTCIDIPQEIHQRSYLHRPNTGSFAPFDQPSVRNSNVVQYSLDMYGFEHDDIIMLVDSDIFLVKEFSIRQFMEGYHLTGFLKNCCSDTFTAQHRTKKPHLNHIWIGLVGINMKTAPQKEVINFNCGFLKNKKLDAGGYTNYYLMNTKGLAVKPIERTCLRELICENCNKNQTLFCTHNSAFLLNKGHSKEFIRFIQDTPILYGKNQFRNSEFFLDFTFVHYRAGSNYNNVNDSFTKAKTKAFDTFIAHLLSSETAHEMDL